MDLFTILESRRYKPFTEVEAKYMFTQVCNALHYCHTQNVVHFDIKLDNIMVNPKNGHITLIDFGLCDFIGENGDNFTKHVGSEDYCPPEFFQPESFSGTKVDVWCLGVVLYALFTAKFPFDPEERKEALVVGLEHPEIEMDFACSEQARDLICKMLAIKPSERITMEEVLAHPWLSKK